MIASGRHVLLLMRAAAIGIAFAGAVDPAVTSNRRTKPTVAVIAADAIRDSAVRDDVERTLSKRFTVIRAPLFTADATLLVGNEMPGESDQIGRPAFVIAADRKDATATIEKVHAQTVATLDSRIPVSAVVHVRAARGRALDVMLTANGVAVDRVSRTVTGDDEKIPVTLRYVPAAAGAAQLRLSATLAGAARTDASNVLVDVRDVRWSVLFYDPRPSWMSTFVRRAIERDRRFVVTSRVVTSRSVGIESGRPPNRLDDLGGLARFDAVIVGAPQTLVAGEVSGLESFMRQRGGSVVFLMDERASGPFERLTGASRWLEQNDGRVVSVRAAGDSSGLRAGDIIWPAELPAGAEVIASGSRPVIWRSPVGAGQLVLSGAVDAWRYRDKSLSAFDAFWQTLIAESASASAPAASVVLSRAVLSPGEDATVTVRIRSAALHPPFVNASNALNAKPVHTAVSAMLEPAIMGSRPNETFRVWPSGSVGTLEGSVRAPRAPGVYRVVVTADGNRAEVPLVVAGKPVMRPAPERPALAAAWASAHGGRVISAAQIGQLPVVLDSALRPVSRVETWHPMRSPWWLIPFALLLGGEWWLRRRRGLA
jgi:hypothetical protein